MSHFAELNANNVVTNVIIAEQDFIDTQEGTWVQTSYNTRGGVHLLGGTPLRKNYAGMDYTYDTAKDAFYSPKPYNSWTLDNTTCLWEAPIDKPSDAYVNGGDKAYTWDDDLYQSDNTKGWVIIE
jgi:hypothetical protein|tara:strand:+ start:915 stop:1289 length:375 start_codon:yes stop_codon:yes gene_type:complete